MTSKPEKLPWLLFIFPLTTMGFPWQNLGTKRLLVQTQLIIFVNSLPDLNLILEQIMYGHVAVLWNKRRLSLSKPYVCVVFLHLSYMYLCNSSHKCESCMIKTVQLSSSLLNNIVHLPWVCFNINHGWW